jgi:threonine synthase
MHTLVKLEGISIEPATAVAFVGLFKLVHNGVIHLRTKTTQPWQLFELVAAQ